MNFYDKNLRRLAEMGNPEAQFKIGDCYYYGIGGVEGQDLFEALEWYRKSAEQVVNLI